MERLKKILITLPAVSILSLSFATSAAALASSSPSSTNTTSGERNTSGDDPAIPPPTNCPPNTNPKEGRPCYFKKDATEVKDTEDQNKQEAAQNVATLKTTQKEHTADERKINCKDLQKGLATKLANMQKVAGKKLDLINKTYAKALAYQKEHNIQVANWDSLIAAANAAQAKATASVVALQALNPNIDCNDPNVAQEIATFEAAVKQAKADLQAYQKAVMAIYSALGIETSETTGGTQ